MKEYIASKCNSTVFNVDYDNRSFNTLSSTNVIDYMYEIEEDGIVTVKNYEGEVESTFEVKVGDILCRMYSITGNYKDKEYMVLTEDNFKDYFKRKKEAATLIKKELEKVKNIEDSEAICCDSSN